MEDWVILSAVGVVGAIAYAMTGVGCATLAFLWFPKLPRVAAALIGSLAAPFLIAIAVLVVTAFTPGSPPPGPFLVGLLIVCAPGVITGWPCAYFAIRALHRRIERAGATAQEIFQ